MTVFEEQYATIWEHLAELRDTLLKIALVILAGFLGALFFYQKIYQWFFWPLVHSVSPSTFSLVLTSPGEGLLCTLNLCFWVSLGFTSPLWLYWLLKFFAPALDEVGQKALIPFVLISEIFLFMGAFFAYFITIPIANRYLFNFNETLGTNLWTLSHYLDYTLLLLVGNALAFELTVIGFFLVHFQLMDYLFLKDKRRYMIVLAFILGAFLTPPDVITQILLAVPLIGLYELMVLYAKKIYLKDREYQNRIDASS